MSIGDKLKTAREAKGVAPEQVYAHTKIHTDLIVALEQDKYERILNPTYIKSFLRKYASYLGLDEQQIVDEYNKVHARKPLQESISFQTVDGSVKKKEKKTPAFEFPIKNVIRAIIWLAVAVIIAVIGLKGVNGLINISTRHHAAALQVAEEKKQQDSSVNPPIVPKTDNLFLTVVAEDEVWLRLQADDKIIFVGTLKRGSTESWKAKNSYVIWTGKAHALRLELNGHSLGLAGNGVVKSLVIDRTGIKK